MPTSTALGCVQCPPTRMLSAPTMTAQRQERNGSRSGMEFRPVIAFFLLLASLGSQAFPQFAARAATTERVVVNRYSGVAIEGFDPVAYFVDARPLVGLPEFETSDAGAVWRFRSEGNRASFVAHPDIYGPSSGATTRSIWRAGSPLPATPGFG